MLFAGRDAPRRVFCKTAFPKPSCVILVKVTKKRGNLSARPAARASAAQGSPTHPRPQLLPLVQSPVGPRVLAWRARGRLLSHRTQPSSTARAGAPAS